VLEACRVVLVVIGPGWFDSRTDDGRRRLDDPEDHVRVEIETVLRLESLLVIPVLVRNASMPYASFYQLNVFGVVIAAQTGVYQQRPTVMNPT
jgi:hypothetical protein